MGKQDIIEHEFKRSGNFNNRCINRHRKRNCRRKAIGFSQGHYFKNIKLTSLKKVQNAPSGFGTFSLIKDGKLIKDHYLSRTRFENILRQED